MCDSSLVISNDNVLEFVIHNSRSQQLKTLMFSVHSPVEKVTFIRLKVIL